jgi:hypothetical protein
VKRCGKSAPAGQATGLARQTPPGARPRRKNDGQPSRAGPARKSFRVGRLKRRVTVALEKWPLSTEPGLSARFGLSFQPLACLLGLGRGRMTGPVFSMGPVRDINLSFWGDPPAPETEEAPRMRSRSTLSLLAVFVLSAGCVSTLRPLPEITFTPADKKPAATPDATHPAANVGQPVADISSTTSLTSRWSKLFGGQGSSDRTALPRADQPLEGSPGGAGLQEIGRDF